MKAAIMLPLIALSPSRTPCATSVSADTVRRNRYGSYTIYAEKGQPVYNVVDLLPDGKVKIKYRDSPEKTRIVDLDDLVAYNGA